MSKAVIIGFRDRGTDPLRSANLGCVLERWLEFAPTNVISDCQTGVAQFNRSAAYNRGAAAAHVDVLIFAEADMLIDFNQIDEAAAMAADRPGLVIPFTHRHDLTSEDSELVRAGRKNPADCTAGMIQHTNYGCINVLSRETLNMIGGWDEQFTGWGHDDCAMWLAFEKAAGPTRFVDGPAWHLYHNIPLEGSPTDRAATERNYRRMQLYSQARTGEEIRHLTAGGKTLSRDWRGRLR